MKIKLAINEGKQREQLEAERIKEERERVMRSFNSEETERSERETGRGRSDFLERRKWRGINAMKETILSCAHSHSFSLLFLSTCLKNVVVVVVPLKVRLFILSLSFSLFHPLASRRFLRDVPLDRTRFSFS